MNVVLEILNDWSGFWWECTLQSIWQTALLVGVITLMVQVFGSRLRPSLRYSLWLLVVLKLLLPFPLSIPWSFSFGVPLVTSVSRPVGDTTAAPVQPARETLLSSGETAEERSGKEIKSSPSVSNDIPADGEMIARRPPGEMFASPEPGDDGFRFKSSSIFFLIWVMGWLSFSATGIRRWHRVECIRRRSRPADAALRSLLEHYREKIGYRNQVDIRVSSEVECPCLAGLAKPTILLPASMIEPLSESQFRTVVLHELCHAARLDPWVHSVQAVLFPFYFYNPFVWWAFREIRRERESAADEWVLYHGKLPPDAYGLSLITIARIIISQPQSAFLPMGIVQNKNHLSKRIKIMMKQPRPKRTRLNWLEYGLIAILGLALIPVANGQKGSSELRGSDLDTTPVALNEQILDADDPGLQQTMEAFQTLDRELMEGVNTGNVNRLVSLFTADGILLPDMENMAVGPEQLRAYYLRTFQQHPGIQILDLKFDFVELWEFDDVIVGSSDFKTTIRLPSLLDTNLLTQYQKDLFVMKKTPEGNLNVRVIASNQASSPATPEAYREGYTGKDVKYHRIEASDYRESEKDIERVVALDREFNLLFAKQKQDQGLAFYADDATLLPHHHARVRGKAAIRQYLEAQKHDFTLQSIEQEVVDTGQSGVMVYVVNQYRWTIREVGGRGESHEFPGKGVHVWMKQPDGQWKIVLDLYNLSIPNR